MKKELLCMLLVSSLGCGQLDDVESTGAEKNHDEVVQTSQGPQALRETIMEAGVYTPEPGDVKSFQDPLVQLGQKLFFDKIVSGGSDISCATCHHPSFGTSDGLPTSIGVGGAGVGPARAVETEAPVIPRNSPDIFNRGVELWTTMFWDARVSIGDIYFDSPAGPALPESLDSVLAVQAMFPPTSSHEMRGLAGSNPVADVAKDDFEGIWTLLIDRILSIDEYVELFAEAYPGVDTDELGFEHAAKAIAAFEVSAFTRLDTPFDRFLAGDDEALTAQEMYGAELFFGKGQCSSCHSGPLFTDQLTHALATPQLGPGKSDDGFDRGRQLETGDESDAFAFRTPPLRNVELTGPYMHAGTYETLEGAIEHHIDPDHALINYTGEHLDETFQAQLMEDEGFFALVIEKLDPALEGCGTVQQEEVSALAAFLRTLTDDSARDMSEIVPTEVPSGLSIF